MHNIPVKRILAIMFLVGTVAMLLGPRLWPQSPEFVFTGPEEFWAQFALKVVEALLFGVGVAFFVIAYPSLKDVPMATRAEKTRSLYCMTWLMASWWPHDNWHLSIGHDIVQLVLIEYAFHATVIMAGLILAYDFIRSLPLPKIVE